MGININHVTNTVDDGHNTLTLTANKYRLGNDVYDDMQGITSSVSGGSALGTLTIRDTGVTIPSFQNIHDDVLHFTVQFSHRKKLLADCGSFHLHCYLPNAPVNGNTLIFDYAYTWLNYDSVIPQLASWTTGTTTYTFTNEVQYQLLIVPIIETIAHPVNESPSSILIVKCTRDSTGVGSDTYNSDLGLIYADVHYPMDKWGTNTSIGDV
jgi:hypothetical protein